MTNQLTNQELDDLMTLYNDNPYHANVRTALPRLITELREARASLADCHNERWATTLVLKEKIAEANAQLTAEQAAGDRVMRVSATAELRKWIERQIDGISRSTLVESSRGALSAFQETLKHIPSATAGSIFPEQIPTEPATTHNVVLVNRATSERDAGLESLRTQLAEKEADIAALDTALAETSFGAKQIETRLTAELSRLREREVELNDKLEEVRMRWGECVAAYNELQRARRAVG